MSFDLSGMERRRTTSIEELRSTVPAADRCAGFASALRDEARAVRLDTLPASPPPEVRDEMLAAQNAVREMYERGRELHFEMVDGRARIELRDLDGNVLKEIPGTLALEIAGGRKVELPR